MPPASLSYPSLQCVLQHMDANVRFKIAQHCPSVRSTERSVLLKIKFLHFEGGEFCINGVTYSLKIYANYPETASIRDAFSDVDVDKYGFVTNEEPEITAGDLFLKFPGTNRVPPSEERLEREIRNKMENIERMKWRVNMDDRRMRKIEESLRTCRAQLVPHQLKQANEQPPWEQYLRFSTNYGKDIFFKYNMKIGHAMKKLYRMIFGNRKFPTIIDQFYMRHLQCDTIIRLPENINFVFREIRIRAFADLILEAISPIVYESSLPLRMFSSLEFPTHPIATTAKEVLIGSDRYERMDNPTTGYLLSLQCSKFLMKKGYHPFKLENAFPIIQNWLDTRKEIGTCFKFDLERIEDGTELVRRFNGEKVVRERKYMIPMNSTSKIDIYYTKNPISLTMEVVES